MNRFFTLKCSICNQEIELERKPYTMQETWDKALKFMEKHEIHGRFENG